MPSIMLCFCVFFDFYSLLLLWSFTNWVTTHCLLFVYMTGRAQMTESVTCDDMDVTWAVLPLLPLSVSSLLLPRLQHYTRM